jgi:branched-chain amino acid transport system substrate-binding protein
MGRIIHRTVLALAACAFAACSRRGDAVRIAVVVPLTGDISIEGQGVRRAVELAVAEAQESGELTFPVEVHAFDDRADPQTAVKAARLILADPRVVAVIGHFTSGCSIAAAPIYAQGSLAMIAPVATNPRLTRAQTEPGWPGPRNVFRLTPTDEVQGAIAAEFALRRLKLRKFSILHDRTPYGQGLAEEFRKRLERLGGKALSFEGISIGDRDFKKTLERIRLESPSGIYFGGLYPEFGLLLRGARKAGLKAPFFSGDGSMTEGLFDAAEVAVEGAYFTSPGGPLESMPGAGKFAEAYGRRYPGTKIGRYDHFGYDAAGVLLHALRHTGPVSGPGRAQLIDVLRGVRYRGVLGTTTFDAKGDTTLKTVTVFKAYKRKFVPVRG